MRTVYAVQFQVQASAQVSEEDVPGRLRDDIRSWISDWYRIRKGVVVDIPTCAAELSPLPLHTVRVTTTTLGLADFFDWQVTWSYPGNPDDRLLWESTCEVAHAAGSTEFSCTVRLVSREFAIDSLNFDLRRPNIVRKIIDSYPCLLNGRSVPRSLSHLDVPGIAPFVRLLTDTQRVLPIVLFSRDLFSDQPMADIAKTADNCIGLAEVFVLADKWAAFELTDRVGRERSCHSGAVRIYWPGFTTTVDPYRHPIYMPQRISSMQAKGDLLQDALFRRFAAISSFRFAPGKATRAAREAIERQKSEELARIRAEARERGEFDGLLDLSEQENTSLTAKNQELTERIEELEQKLATAEANLTAVWTNQDADDDTTVESIIADDIQVFSVPEAVTSARDRFSDTLVFLDSAMSSAKDSPYGQPEKVYRALQALDEVCKKRRQSLTLGQSVGSLEKAFGDKGFPYKAHVSMTSKGKWSEDYTALYKGKKISVEQHLILGKGNPTTCLRIYFYWDEVDRKFIIDTVGRHKTNTKS